MKKVIALISMLITTAFSHAFADDTNNPVSSCDAEISIKLKETTTAIKTNESVISMIQIKNLSTNRTLVFWMGNGNMPSDFIWVITSPSGKDLSPKPDLLHEAISGSFPKLKPLESDETEYDLSSVCSFNEIGTYTIIVKKEIFVLLPERKKYEIISNPLNIVVSK